ncbi:MAG: hypothetical protein QHH04_08310 [Methanolinea sp.]|nr:hypothetical protein [Methanolinea sp.]
MGIAMTVFALFIGRQELRDAGPSVFIGSIHTAFLVFSCLYCLGIAFSLVRSKGAA